MDIFFWLCSFAFVCLMMLFWSILRADDPRLPPKLPGSLPFIGHAHLILLGYERLWETLQNVIKTTLESGGTLRMSLGSWKYHIITNPEDFFLISNTCLHKDSLYFNLAKSMMTSGLLIAPVDTWRRHRKLMSPSFNQRVLDGYMAAVNEHSRLLVDRLASKVGKDAFNHHRYLERTTLGLSIQNTMGIEVFNEDSMELFIEAVTTYFENRTCNILQQIWFINEFIYSFTPYKKKQDEVVKYVHNFAERIIEKKRSAFVMDTPTDLSSKFKSVLDILLTDGRLTDSEIRDEVISTIVGSFDTTALTMTYILLLIGSYPEVQKKVYEELNNIFKGSNRDVVKEDLMNLVYLDAVIKESLRFYPIAPFISRYIHQDVQLKNYTLLAGANCLLAIYGINRCAAWGPDANEFKPERWLKSDVPTNAFASFGLGKRNCIGYRYGMMSIKVLLCHILRKYRIYGDHSKVKFKYMVFLKPVSGHEIRIEERTSEGDRTSA